MAAGNPKRSRLINPRWMGVAVASHRSFHPVVEVFFESFFSQIRRHFIGLFLEYSIRIMGDYFSQWFSVSTFYLDQNFHFLNLRNIPRISTYPSISGSKSAQICLVECDNSDCFHIKHRSSAFGTVDDRLWHTLSRRQRDPTTPISATFDLEKTYLQYIAGWWFVFFWNVHPYLGKWSNLTSKIKSDGWQKTTN